MLRGAVVVCLLLLTGCIAHNKLVLTPSNTKLERTEQYQREIDKVLAEDDDSKKWELIYLKEIKAAQENDDMDTYRFFLKEYIEIPRYILPEWMKQEPGYVPRVSVKDLDSNRTE